MSTTPNFRGEAVRNRPAALFLHRKGRKDRLYLEPRAARHPLRLRPRDFCAAGRQIRRERGPSQGSADGVRYRPFEADKDREQASRRRSDCRRRGGSFARQRREGLAGPGVSECPRRQEKRGEERGFGEREGRSAAALPTLPEGGALDRACEFL